MGKVTSEWVVETDGAQSNIAELARAVAEYNETIGKADRAGKKAFNDSATAAKDFNRELANGTKIYQKVGTDAAAFRSEIKRLETVYADLRKNQKQFIAEGRYDELQKNIAGTKARIAELKGELGESNKQTSLFSKLWGGIGAQIAGIGIIGILSGIGMGIFNVTAEFQKFEAVLTNTLGSNLAAERSMLMIQDFAAKTPYSVAELTDSYVKFANRGLKLTNAEMRALGDIAASTGKSFDQLTEAALDAFSGENERLKEFGITAQKAGEKTFFTFKGVTTEVKNTDAAVKEYLISLGNVEGVSGSMAAISETLTGKVSNLGDTFDKLFLTLGNQSTGVLGGTIGLVNDLTESLIFLVSTTEQLGKEKSAEAVTKYANELTEKFKGISKEAKSAGKDIKEALDIAAFGEKAPLQDQLLEAEAALKAFQSKRNSLATRAAEYYEPLLKVAVAPGTLFRKGGIDALEFSKNKNAEAELSAAVELARGKIHAIEDAKKEILKVGGSGVDPAALKAAEKARKDAEKKAAAERKKALAELEKELADLEKQAAKARLEMMDKNSIEYQDALLKQRRKEIAIIKDELISASEKAGKGGKLGKKQLEQLGILDEAALQDYNEAVQKINQDQADKLLDLQKDSDEKILLQISNKYQKQIEAAKKAGNDQLVQALENARKLELAETGQGLDLARIGKAEAFETAEVEGKVFALGDDFPEVKLEEIKQEAILQVQLKYAKKRLAFLESYGGEENKTLILQTQNIISKLEQELAKPKDKKFDLLDLLGVKPEDRDEVKDAFGEVVGFIQDFTAKQLEAANELLDRREKDVEDKREDLNTEIELNKLGFASNVETKRAELEESKRLRAAALEDQKKAQKAQAAVETITQTIGLISASVDIIKGFAKIPIIGLPLGIAAVATMFGGFISAKAKAAKATKMESGGLLGGKRHSQGGNKYYAENGDLLEHEDGEFFVNRKATAKRLDWLEAINKDDEEKLAELAVKHLLNGTGVVPAKNTAKKAQAKNEAYALAAAAGSGNFRLDKVERELAAIRKNTSGDGLQFENEKKKVYKFGNVTRTVNKKA